MSRLGAKRTVKGYLSKVRSHALLGELDNSPLPKHVGENWDKLLDGLGRRWSPSDFADLISSFHADVGWGFAAVSKRGVLGPEEHFAFCCPSIVDLVHSDRDRPDLPCWSEHGLTIQGWKGRARRGKAKIEAIPSRLIFAPHALERIYERTGGCDYEDFPALISKVADTILHKLDTLLEAGVMVTHRDYVGVTAFPIENGLAIIEINHIFTHSALPQIGSAIRVRGGEVKQYEGSLRLIDESDPQEFCVDDLIVTTGYTRMYNVRTFYGDEEIGDQRSESRQCLGILLDHLDASKTSLYSLMDVTHPNYPNDSAAKPVDWNSRYFKGLVEDAIQSLDWLRLHRADHLFIFYDGQGDTAGAAITASRTQ